MQVCKRLYLSYLTAKFLAFLFLLSSFLLLGAGCSKLVVGNKQKSKSHSNLSVKESRVDSTSVLPKDSLSALLPDSLLSEVVTAVVDSLPPLVGDSLQANVTDSLALEAEEDIVPEVPLKESQIDAKIEYSAKDSIVFFSNGTGFLHNGANLKYKTINLDAGFVRLQSDSSILFATGLKDSIGDISGNPVFGEGDQSYNSKEIRYNLKTKKGFVKGVVTQEGEAYIVSENVKKTSDQFICVGDAKYTTCDNHEHPHFYFHIKKGKIKPQSHLVSGPVNLVLADVPLPIVIPFAFFPFNTSYSSGLLMPTYSDELNRGFGLINGGYYLAISDYFDVELRSEIYTKGTWALNARSGYLKRYKFRGNVAVNYREDVTGEKDMPDYAKNKSLAITWSHSQDAKANPDRTFSANVNFSTSGYNRNNINTYHKPEINSQNTKSSSISFSQRFPSIPGLSISGGMQVAQRTRDSTINLQLPNLSISLSRLYPLKRKNAVGKERWYEKISVSYSGTLSNSIETKENKLLKSSFMRDWKNGMRHSIPIAASFSLFNYININPTFSYDERWNTVKFKKSYDKTTQKVVTDTINGFNRNYDFRMGVSAQTKLYGYYIPNRKLFGDKLDRVRHVLTPSVGFSYRPDFSDPMWGNYSSYAKESLDGTQVEDVKYSIHAGSLYGGPSAGRNGSVNFSLTNNLEMKIRNDKDTTGKEAFKKISLIDNFSVSSSYNLMADSMNLSNFSTNLRLKFGKTGSRSISLSGAFDPYIFELDAKGNPRRVNKMAWSNGRFPIFLGTNISHSLTINNDTFKKLLNRFSKKEDKNSEAKSDISGEETENMNNEDVSLDSKPKKREVEVSEDGYEKAKIPFSITANYSVGYRPSGLREDFLYDKMRYKMVFVHNLSLSANLKITENWNMSGNTSYDFKAKQFTQLSVNVTRNLHCWTMSGSFSPFGYYKSYHFTIGVNASMLSDVKYEKQNRRGSSTPIDWY